MRMWNSYTDGSKAWVSQVEPHRLICTMSGDPIRRDAEARLIAHAPELLEHVKLYAGMLWEMYEADAQAGSRESAYWNLIEFRRLARLVRRADADLD